LNPVRISGLLTRPELPALGILASMPAEDRALLSNYPEAAVPLLSGLLTCLCHRIRRMNEKLAARSSVSAAAQWLH